MILLWAGLTYLLTLAGALWLLATGDGPQDLTPAILLIAFSPTLAAFAAAAWSGRWRELARQILDWRHDVRWYAVVLLAPIAIALVIDAVFAAGGGQTPERWLLLPGIAILGPLLTNPLGEEFGWRGYGGPLLQRRITPLAAAVVIGLLWTVWHLWPVLNPEGHVGPVDVVQSVVRLVATSVVYAWLYNRTGLPVVLVAHLGHNLSIEMMPPEVIGSDLGQLTLAAVYLLLAVAVVVYAGRDLQAPRRPVGVAA
ncbi:lysostaphin resistance A-like protein [Nonomuraea sp. NPDC050663]|uniref:lysostaphin resistance A-like protein n=1 Tax=Nonomuraea sp. NPDC050663 TaxID=3364370 RepID=UPI00379291E6